MAYTEQSLVYLSRDYRVTASFGAVGASASAGGAVITDNDDEQLTDAFHYTLFPNFAVSLWSDGFHFLRARPHPTDPEQCIFDNWWYASQPEGETAPIRTTAGIVDRNAETEHEVFTLGERSMGRTIDQDIEIFPLQQAGFRSRGYEGAYLADQESRVRRNHELIDDYIEGRR